MSKFYFLCGPPRSAKTTIVNEFSKLTNIQSVAADSILHGFRNVITGSPHQLLKDIRLKGSAVHKVGMNGNGPRKDFDLTLSEKDATLGLIEGMIDYFSRNDQSAIFEGSAIDADWVSSMKAKGLETKVVSIGYQSESHADTVILHAKDNPSDWINVWLDNENGDETSLRKWISTQVAVSREVKTMALENNCAYYDICSMSFIDFKSTVIEDLMA
jgi:hypothetical protein